MRHVLILLVLVGLFAGMAQAANLSLKARVGYNGYYRSGTLVPISVEVENKGEAVRGEYRVTTGVGSALHDRYRFPVHLPRGAKRLDFLYVIPSRFSREITVEFWSRGQMVTSSTDKTCVELYSTDRLVVTVGGTGSSLFFMNGEGINTPEYAMARPWAYGQYLSNWQRLTTLSKPHISFTPPHPPGGIAPTPIVSYSGKLYVVPMSPLALPPNPEAYGSVSTMVLLSDVTENTLRNGAEKAVPLWVASGGNLVIAGGGIAARLSAPFYRNLLTASQPTVTKSAVGTATTSRLGSGWVTLLGFDPDTVKTANWKGYIEFFRTQLGRTPQVPALFVIGDIVNSAITVRNLQAPDLKTIVIFLLVYLVMLVPVNYFVLKRMDRRELAWVTTPVIVLVFAFGAYGIGYLTKGHSLITNLVSVVETGANQPAGEAVSTMLIFSPARTTYKLALGDTGLIAREAVESEEYDPYGYGGTTEPPTSPLDYTMQGERVRVDRVPINMWDFRQFVLAHRVDLGMGLSAKLHPRSPATTPRATGTVTNKTPYNFALCELYYNGAWVSSFQLQRGQTVTVERAATPPNLKLSEEKQYMLDTLRSKMSERIGNGPMADGFVLLGYSEDLRVPVTLSGRKPTASLGIVIAHL